MVPEVDPGNGRSGGLGEGELPGKMVIRVVGALDTEIVCTTFGQSTGT